MDVGKDILISMAKSINFLHNQLAYFVTDRIVSGN